MREKVKFTVIIPTRERADTLYHCLRTIIAQDYENLTILVSDNFSQDNTKKVVDSFDDPRIRYINTGKRVSMSHNWEFALNHVTDGWVTFVGDDDALLPRALARVSEVIQQTNCQAIVSKWCAYDWPNSTVNANRLHIPLTSGIEQRNGPEWLSAVMHGHASYLDLPHLYTGAFADISVINQARNVNGIFFLSMTPDVYSGIALASILDHYVMLKDPVAIAGISIHSNGASTLGIGTNKIPAQKFYSEKNIPFHSKLTGGEVVKSIPILAYECYLQSIHLHIDFLNVKIKDQLELALNNINLEHYEDLKKFCFRVAKDNDITLFTSNYKKTIIKKESFFNRFKIITNLFCCEVTVSGKEYGIQNVHEAALLANGIFLFKIRHASCIQNIFSYLLKTRIEKSIKFFKKS